MSQLFVVQSWTCIPDCEKNMCLAMAEASQSLTPFVLVGVIRNLLNPCTGGGGNFRTERLRAWQNNYKVTRLSIEIDGEDVPVFLANQPWMTELYNCFIMSDCLPGDPTCLLLNFYNAP